MKKIAVVSLVLLFTGAIPISCNMLCFSSCGCGDFDTPDYSISSFSMLTINSMHEEIDTTKIFSFDAIYKKIQVTDVEIVSFQDDYRGGLFVNVAQACSPAPPSAVEHFQTIKITSLSNITLNNSTDLIKAGDTITDRFVMAREYAIDFQNIDDFIKTNYELRLEDSFWIRVAKKPYQPTSLLVNISVTMTNGRTFEFLKQVMKVQ